MIINQAKLLELVACAESLRWIGDKEYPYTPDGVRAALAAGAEPEWLQWLFRETGCTDAEMWELVGVRVITEDAEVTSGCAVCLVGSPAITVIAGWVGVYGKAEPTITVIDGWVDVSGDATPAVIVSGGEVYIYGAATPAVTVSGGEVYVYGDAKPVVRRENGTELEPVVDTYGRRIYRV